jgi:phospholipid transport system substrate-binding protein
MLDGPMLPLAPCLILVLAATPSATEALKAREAEVRKLLPAEGTPMTPAVRKQAEKALTQGVDMDHMASSSLGNAAASVSPAQRKAYDAAFRQRFARVSGEQVEAFRSNRIKYLGEQPGDDGVVKVTTEATVDAEPSQIVYVMRATKSEWRIEDIVIDGVSTVDNFKRSFGRIIAKEGIEALITRLKSEGT